MRETRGAKAGALWVQKCMPVRPIPMLRKRRVGSSQSRAWQGLHDYEAHRAPLGALILDAKYCEMCGCNFLRRAQSKNRYCSKCLLTILCLNRHQGGKVRCELIH